MQWFSKHDLCGSMPFSHVDGTEIAQACDRENDKMVTLLLTYLVDNGGESCLDVGVHMIIQVGNLLELLDRIITKFLQNRQTRGESRALSANQNKTQHFTHQGRTHAYNLHA